ncbi:hypothetical protein VTL71DRAFT_6836 [Oculimacula yallundae]|uniref:Zn(2)-C6 fungal-type domain-containing protein n=1 Tax=Oculimacula yallundae TaxID=86028 RepID=A0ABR4BWK9_9HELO
MAKRLRSSTGCWTCRLRRKKCDETRPVCDRCSRLQLTCEGYIDRPYWMDGGVLEKIRAEQTKQEVRNRKGITSSKDLTYSQDAPANGELAIPSSARKDSDASVRDSTGQTHPDFEMSGPVALDSMGLNSESVFDLWPPEDHQNWNIFSYPCEQDLNLLFGTASTSSGADHQFPSSTSLPLITSTSTTLSTTSNSSTSLHYRRPSSSRSAPRDITGPLSRSPSSVPSVVIYPSSSSTSSSGGESGSSQSKEHCVVQTNVKEAGLLLWYLDNAHTLLPPFCWPMPSDRAWQYVLIMRTKASFWATLSLSAYSQGQDGSTYYDLGLFQVKKSLQTSDQTSGNALDRCFSLMQFVILEILRGQTDACKKYLRAAMNIFSGLRLKQRDSPTSATTSPAECLEKSADIAALEFISTCLRFCDIMVSCSLRVSPIAIDFKWDVINTHKCHDSSCNHVWRENILSSFAQVCALDLWKRGATDAGQLSVVDLVNRATTIESSLKNCQNFVQPDRNGIEKCDNPLPVAMQENLRHVAGIFTSSMLVYLHVIIAGANRWLPDVANHVRATIDLFRKIPSSQLLSHLAWPLCLVGCLAEGDDRAFIMAVAEVASGQDNVHCSRKVTRIIKQCWWAADSGDVVDPDWTLSMSSLGHEVILL